MCALRSEWRSIQGRISASNWMLLLLTLTLLSLKSGADVLLLLLERGKQR